MTFNKIMSLYFRPDRRLKIRRSVFFGNVSNFISRIRVSIHVIKVRFTTTLMRKRRCKLSAKNNLDRRTNNTNQNSNRANGITTSMLLRLLMRFQIDFARTISRQIILFTFYVMRLRYTTFFNRFCKKTVNIRYRHLICLLQRFNYLFDTVARSRNNGRITFYHSTCANATTLNTFLMGLLPRGTFYVFRIFAFKINVCLTRSTLCLLRFGISSVIRSTLNRDCVLLR